MNDDIGKLAWVLRQLMNGKPKGAKHLECMEIIKHLELKYRAATAIMPNFDSITEE